MTLSDKIRFVDMIIKAYKKENKYQYVIKVKDVKQFIKELKDEMVFVSDIDRAIDMEVIDKLAGDKLLEQPKQNKEKTE